MLNLKQIKRNKKHDYFVFKFSAYVTRVIPEYCLVVKIKEFVDGI